MQMFVTPGVCHPIGTLHPLKNLNQGIIFTISQFSDLSSALALPASSRMISEVFSKVHARPGFSSWWN